MWKTKNIIGITAIIRGLTWGILSQSLLTIQSIDCQAIFNQEVVNNTIVLLNCVHFVLTDKMFVYVPWTVA